MVKILANLPAAVQAAQAVSTIPVATQIAQQALASTARVTDATKSLAACKLDAAGNMLIRAAGGSYLPLDELMNGPLLPRIVELGNLREKAELLFDIPESKAFSAIVDVRIDKLADDLSSAEMIQLALRPDAHEFSGEISVRPCLAGPDGNEIDFADLHHNPIYPSVKERLALKSWGRHFYVSQQKTLAAFCRQKAELLGKKMSDAENVQFSLIEMGERARPRMESPFFPTRFNDASGRAWTLTELKEQPLAPSVQSLKKWSDLIDQCKKQFESVETVAERARFAVEAHAVARQMSRLLIQLSDAELLQFCMR